MSHHFLFSPVDWFVIVKFIWSFVNKSKKQQPWVRPKTVFIVLLKYYLKPIFQVIYLEFEMIFKWQSKINNKNPSKYHISLFSSRLAHFEYVQASDLERIGLSKPAIRRLLAAVKQKQRSNLKKPSTNVSKHRIFFLIKVFFSFHSLPYLHHQRIPVWYLHPLFISPIL
jgi:uncharacterized protein (DUF486 family)